MTEITTYNFVNIGKIMSNLALVKTNPSAIQRLILDALDEITNGEVDIVDPTNPFVFLLESSAVNTALAINENMINLRRQYPALGQTEDDIYLHMSDKDFINRFATPSDTNFTFTIQLASMYANMVYDPVEKCGKVTIPRDTEFTIDNITFTLQYPITFCRYDNGTIQVRYDTAIASPLQTLTSNIIDYTLRRDNLSVDWLYIKIPVSQFKIQTAFFAIQLSNIFAQTIQYTDQYYYCRVFYRNTATNNQWSEIKTTHTDQVFDNNTPTAVLKVYSDMLVVTIPKIYFTTGLLSGEIRVDVYTTKGQLTVNLANYKLESFQNILKAIDEPRDINDYTNALLNTTYFTYSDEFISGGTNGIDFQTLRDRVIFNSIGDRQIPITPTQITAFIQDIGFDLIKNVDVITNRIFLATQKLPDPIDTRLLTAANIGINTFITNINALSTLDLVALNNARQTILSNNLFTNNNGILTILNKNDKDVLFALPRTEFINNVNTNYYLYNPFYYVLDNSTNEFEVRAYNLDYPVASNLSFIQQNQTLQLPVNTDAYALEKITQGYKLTISTKSGNFYKQLENENVGVQLGYYPANESSLAYINGTLASVLSSGERVYEFIIETNYDVNKQDQLAITNSHMFNNEAIVNYLDLNTIFYLFHYTTSITEAYVPNESDTLLGKIFLPSMAACVTYESLSIKLGSALSNLWKRSRSFSSGLTYQIYNLDVPLLYDKVIYKTDPVTNSIFSIGTSGELVYEVLHQIGDPVLDANGDPVYKYRKGDVVLDNAGNPVVIADLSVDKEIDLLLVDGKYYFTTDASFVNYKAEIAATIDTWITENLTSVQDILLDQTRIFFYPKTTLGMVKIYGIDNVEDTIASEQSLIVDLYVASDVHDNIDIRNNLKTITIKTLNSYINKATINITEITAALKTLYGNSVQAVNVYNLAGSKDYKLINLAVDHNSLSLKKILVEQQDKSLIIQEDVEVNFLLVDKALN